MHSKIPILRPKGHGHQFVMYGDSCSGVPDALHESTFQQVNRVLQRLKSPPEFICYPGDEIMGLTTDEAELRTQWDYWFNQEMAWLDRDAIPLYHTTGNHTTYDVMSENVFRDVMRHLPTNGPDEQIGLSYFVRRDDLLMVFVHTLWSGLGGEGHVETTWLEAVLSEHSDAKHKLVFGHHPVFTVNGFFADYQRNIEYKNGRALWDVLVKHEVLAYVCSHILAFDVQVHEGVLQICTAGAGTAHRMPEDVEYLHALQCALDDDGLRYQVLDTNGHVREWLTWGDWQLPSSDTWATFDNAAAQELESDCLQQVAQSHLMVWEISGQLAQDDAYRPQTLLAAHGHDGALPGLWLGIAGRDNHLMFALSPRPNRSPHSWHGVSLQADEPFRIQVAIHSGMGAGGLMWRRNDDTVWTSFTGSSAWGVERLQWSHDWTIGHNREQENFHGDNLRVKWHHQVFDLGDYLARQ